MKELTERQNEILNYIKSYHREHKYPPTVREVAAHFNVSIKAGYDHIRALKRKQYINYNGNRSRTIEVVNNDDEKEGVTGIPLLGNVQAGVPLLSEENYNGKIEIPTSFMRSGNYFGLTIKGDSMIEAGILEGDIAIIKQQKTAENGEIVVAKVNDAITIKYYHLEKSRIRLKAANPAYSDILTRNPDIIVGKLVYIIRQYGK